MATTVFGVFAVVAATLMAWWVWLGWDTEYRIDPVTGASSGPYEVGQVAGCVLSLIVIVFAGAVFLRPWLVATVVTATFTIAWSWSAARTDESGLWVVGALLVLVGTGLGSTVVSVAAQPVRRRMRPRTAPVTTR